MIELPAMVPTAMIAFPTTTIGVGFFIRFWTRTVKDKYFPFFCPGITFIRCLKEGMASESELKE